MKEFWTSSASLLGVLASLMIILQVVFPPELKVATFNFLSRALRRCSSYCYYDIAEIDGVNTNKHYNNVQLYLNSLVSASCSRLSLTRTMATCTIGSSITTFGLFNNDSIDDVFNDIAVQWEHMVTQRQSQTFSCQPLTNEKRSFRLWIRKQSLKRDKDLIFLNSYLNNIRDKADDIRRKSQQRLLYTNSCGNSKGEPWDSMPFKHPSTFDTLAIDPDTKRNIVKDLHNFVASRAFYQQTGRAWKRCYLLYGLPGTGKWSMISAMANFLSYDIYNLELTEVHSESDLRNLLRKTSANSIIVIKDIDCLLNPSNRSTVLRGDEDGNNNTITFERLLNFLDDLWPCYGSERIFVFTTDHIEKLDPALLCSSRMDMQICMG